MILISLTLNIILSIANFYFYYKLEKMGEEMRLLNEKVLSPVVVEESIHLSNEIILGSVISVVLVLILFKGVSFVGDTSVYKIAKVVDKNVSHLIDYFSKPESHISFIDKSTGYDVSLKMCGDSCTILFRSSKSAEYFDLKSLISLSDMVAKSVVEAAEVISSGPTDAAVAFFS